MLLVAVAVIVVSIGLPLFGVRVFLATDSLSEFAPWRDVKPQPAHSANPLLGDTYDVGMPIHVEFRRRIFSGEFPKWTSEPSGGVPLAVTPDSGILSPLNLPYLIFPIWYAPAAAKLLEMAVALGFTFLFLRRLGVSRPAGLLGGLVYVNSGFQVVWTNWPQSHVGALIPALFWAVERALVSRRPRDAVPIALVVATMFLEGFPAVTAYSLIAAAVYVCARVLSERRVPIRRRLSGGAWTAAGVGLGIGFAMFQLLPFVFHFRDLHLSYRIFRSPLPSYAFETLVIPNAVGSPAARTWFGQHANYVEMQSFIGATALILVIAGLVRRSRRQTVPGARGFVYGGIAFTAALMYGGGPLLKVVQMLPLLGMNFIGRLRSVFGFLLAVAAAIGFAAVTDRLNEERRRVAEAVALGGTAIVGVLLFVHVWSVAHGRPQSGYVLRQTVIPLLAGVAALILVARSMTSREWRRWAAFALPALVAIECVAFVLPFWPRVPRSEYYPVTSAHRFLLDHLHGDRLAASQVTMYPGTTTVYGIRSVTSHTFQSADWNELMTAIDPRAFVRGPTLPVLGGTERVASSPVLDRLNARYFAVDPNVPIFGRPMPARPAVATTILRPGRTIEAPITGPRIRGVSVHIVGRGPPERRPLVTAQIIDARGRVIGSGTRRVPAEFRGGKVLVPIAGEPVGGRVRLSVADSTGLGLRTTASRVPVVSPIVARTDGLRLVFAGPAVIYERLNALPRVRWAAKTRVVEHGPDRLRLLKLGVPADTALLDAPNARASGRSARVRLTRDDENGLVISADAEGFGYVVIADALRHGWKASVDGRPAPLVGADHALVAVPTPAGHHEIRVWYHPKGFRPGVHVTLMSVLLTIAALTPNNHDRVRNAKEESS